MFVIYNHETTSKSSSPCPSREHFDEELEPFPCPACPALVCLVSLVGIGSRGEAPAGTYYCLGQEAVDGNRGSFCSIECYLKDSKKDEDDEVWPLEAVDFDGCRVGGLKACPECDASSECHGQCLMRLWTKGISRDTLSQASLSDGE